METNRENQLAEALARATSRHLGRAVRVEALEHLSGGASRETWAFDAVDPDGVLPLILRRDPESEADVPDDALGERMDRATEYAVIAAAAAAGVLVPKPCFLLRPADGAGTGFVMERVPGETIARRILRDDAYRDAHGVMAAQCGRILVGIHAIDRVRLPALPVLSAAAQIAMYRGILDDFGVAHPGFEFGLRWLERNRPAGRPDDRLVHGDFRNGNIVVGAEGVRAALDWELAHLGDPIEDLGWLCVKAWRFGAAPPVGGFGDRDDLVAGYEAAGGGPVAAELLRYWEVFGTMKWGVICLMQAFKHLRGAHRSVELAAIGRRAAETEYDLLNLIG